jgi:phospholipid N-methyltransferase
MSDKLDYPGKELEIFDKAIFWRKYLYSKIKKFLGKEILEVGAGMGSFTRTYLNKNMNVMLTELDSNLLNILKKSFNHKENITIEERYTKNIEKKFETILYISVLEHIKDDNDEIKIALSKLKQNGNLIICVPAHNYMYSKFDKEIGHYRRYNIDFFKSLKLDQANIEKCFFLDSTGWFVYFLNKLFFKNEDYPSIVKVLIWDRLLIPISIILDYLTFFKLGKNIICIIKKN